MSSATCQGTQLKPCARTWMVRCVLRVCMISQDSSKYFFFRCSKHRKILLKGMYLIFFDIPGLVIMYHYIYIVLLWYLIARHT